MLTSGIKLASMAKGYQQYFEVLPALSDELRWHNFRLRHEVYARELGWEPHRDDHLEADSFDARSLHTLVRAVDSNRYVAGARLVFADRNDIDAPMPFEIACADTLDAKAIAAACPDRSRLGEISRLAVIAQYRRRRGESCRAFCLDDNSELPEPDRVRLPHLTLGLYLSLIALARWQGLKVLFMLAEPALARSIGHHGVAVVRVGQQVIHRGVRYPYMMHVDAIVDGLSDDVRSFYDSIYDRFLLDFQRATQ